MSDNLAIVTKLEDSTLWRMGSAIAKEAYAVLDKFPEEEKWGMSSKLRAQAFIMTSDIAEAEGTTDPRSQQYKLALARGELFAIKNVYKLAHDTAILQLQPEAMVSIDKLVKLIDEKLASIPLAIEAWDNLRELPVAGEAKL